VNGVFVVVATGLALEARIAAGPGVRCVAGGMDATRLAAGLEREIVQGAAAVMSFGIAGGLAPDVVAGTPIVARGVVSADGNHGCDERWLAALREAMPEARVGEVASVDAPLVDADAKCALYARTHALAVDTESHIAARIAHAHALPFAVFRVIADPVGHSLPAGVAAALGAGGHVDVVRVVRALAAKPSDWLRLPQTAIDAGLAFGALLRGRRRLGVRLGCDARTLLFDVP
jgi:hopanoid-associated phosphorylase